MRKSNSIIILLIDIIVVLGLVIITGNEAGG